MEAHATAKQAAAICAVSVPLNGMKDDAQADRPFRPNFPQFAAATSGSREKLYLVGEDGRSGSCTNLHCAAIGDEKEPNTT